MDKEKIAETAIARTKPTFERMVVATKILFPKGEEFVLCFDDDEFEGSVTCQNAKVIGYSINHTLNSISVEFKGEYGLLSMPLDYLLLKFKNAIKNFRPNE